MPHATARLDFRSPVLPHGGLSFPAFDSVITASTPADVLPALAALAAAQRAGYHAVGFLAYEAALGLGTQLLTHPPQPGLPLLWFGLSRHAVAAPQLPPGNLQPLDWQPRLSQVAYTQNFDHIQANIAAGNTYQVNYTFPLDAHIHDAPADVYAALYAAQPADYAATISTPEFAVISVSPELFFAVQGRHITTQPMKGTRPRGHTATHDAALRDQMRSSPKDRAENVMIVDLLRNDLGRVAEFGSVHVPDLFTVVALPTVWQMVSTVTATLRADVGVADIFTALFPCGSVTGAPKVSTMRIIRATETAPRGVYCGAIGYLAPDGDMVFNVAIRTLMRFADGRAQYHVGSGLVADSTAADEYAECLLKADALKALTPPLVSH